MADDRDRFIYLAGSEIKPLTPTTSRRSLSAPPSHRSRRIPPKEIEVRKILASFMAAAATAASTGRTCVGRGGTVVTFAPTHAQTSHAEGLQHQRLQLGRLRRDRFRLHLGLGHVDRADRDLQLDQRPLRARGSASTATARRRSSRPACRPTARAASPVDSMWYEMYPANPVYPSASTYPVTAGDSITASVTYAGSTFTLVLKNNTRGWTFTIAQDAAHRAPPVGRGHHRVADRGLPELRHGQLHHRRRSTARASARSARSRWTRAPAARTRRTPAR